MAMKRETRVLVAGVVVISLLVCLLGLRQESTLSLVDIHVAAKKVWAPITGVTRRPTEHSIPHPPEPKERLAYATWLSSTVSDPDKDDFNDSYFIATRMLVYQLLHAPTTRTNKSIDVVVVVTPDVSESRRERLRKDGAIVRPIDFLYADTDWLRPMNGRWRDIMSKLRVWELTEYSRIVMLDGDMILQRSLDGIFDDPSAKIVKTLHNVTHLVDEGTLPSEYLLASMGEIPGPDHKYPPDWDDFYQDGYGRFCAGFFLLSPSKEIFTHYKTVLNIEGRFDSLLMEQNLLNYAHRWSGPMPWKEIASTWNIRSANDNDFDQGVASMHEKWWEYPVSGSEKLHDYFMSVRWQMEGYYQALDDDSTCCSTSLFE